MAPFGPPPSPPSWSPPPHSLSPLPPPPPRRGPHGCLVALGIMGALLVLIGVTTTALVVLTPAAPVRRPTIASDADAVRVAQQTLADAARALDGNPPTECKGLPSGDVRARLVERELIDEFKSGTFVFATSLPQHVGFGDEPRRGAIYTDSGFHELDSAFRESPPVAKRIHAAFDDLYQQGFNDYGWAAVVTHRIYVLPAARDRRTKTFSAGHIAGDATLVDLFERRAVCRVSFDATNSDELRKELVQDVVDVAQKDLARNLHKAVENAFDEVGHASVTLRPGP